MNREEELIELYALLSKSRKTIQEVWGNGSYQDSMLDDLQNDVADEIEKIKSTK